jgi:Tfp pilus assembly protein PilF
MIHHDLGELDKAREFLSRALKTNPNFHVRFAEQARVIVLEIDSAGGRVSATQSGERR